MFFGGFSGTTAFYPSRVVNSSFVPRTVLTEFRLSGIPVPIGPESPLKRSITCNDFITLSHEQNMFSIEFSALSYFYPETNRYRYKLEGLDNRWHEIGSNQRTANYTTLPVGTYFFNVQGATSRGDWSEPGARLRIEILPAWYQTSWFRAMVVALSAFAMFAIHRMRLHGLMGRLSLRFEERLAERTRIARELHDTLLQSFHGLIFRFQTVYNLLPSRPVEAKQTLESALDDAAQAITEARDAVHELRSSAVVTNDLAAAITALGEELVLNCINTIPY
jgi:signal transduction histidine kinase